MCASLKTTVSSSDQSNQIMISPNQKNKNKKCIYTKLNRYMRFIAEGEVRAYNKYVSFAIIINSLVFWISKSTFLNDKFIEISCNSSFMSKKSY